MSRVLTPPARALFIKQSFSPKQQVALFVFFVPAVLAIAAYLLQQSGWDERLSALVFDPATAAFPARAWPLLELIGHRLAKSAMFFIWLVLLAAAAASTWATRLQSHRTLLWTTVIAMAAGPLLVVLLKGMNSHPCPWDLVEFGGVVHYSAHWFVSYAEAGRCFPSGHAAGGFSLFAVYFATVAAGQPRAQRWILRGTLICGLVFSLVRVLQGAHFVSHNLWSAAVDWLSAAIIFAPLLLRRFSGAQAAQGLPSSALHKQNNNSVF